MWEGWWEGGRRGGGEGREGVARKGPPFLLVPFFLVPVGDVSLVKAVRWCPLMGAYGAAPCGRARARAGGEGGACGAPAAKRPIFPNLGVFAP
jgi:hypothetical protein